MKVDKDFQNAFDGLMLGDGCVSQHKGNVKYGLNKKYYYYTQKCKFKEWLDVLSLWFKDYSFDAHVSMCNCKPNNYCHTEYIQYFLQVNSVMYFKEQRLRYYSYEDNSGWTYDKIIKHVPKDIVFSQEGLANWYMGDGSYDIYNNHIQFSTDGFLEEDVDFLCDKLIELGLNAYKNKSRKNYFIRIGKKSDVDDFIEYVKPYIHPIYSYKLNMSQEELIIKLSDY